MQISIIGAAGNIGADVAFLIAQNELADELSLIDILDDKVKGVALDIEYSCGYKKTKVNVGTYDNVNQSDIIIISAGKPLTKETKSRDELLDINSKILSSIINQIKNDKAMFVIITNPVDALVSKVVEFGIPEDRVVGMSTIHDTLRLRAILKRRGFNDSKSHITGKHGEGNFIINEEINIDPIKDEINASGKTVRELRGSTSYGTAAATTEIVRSIINNNETIASVHKKGSIPVKFENFKRIVL